MVGEAVVDLAEVSEEGAEVAQGRVDVPGAHHLAAGVHGELRHAEVDCAHARSRRHDGADGAPARTVVAHLKLID